VSRTVYIICVGPRWGYPKRVEGSLFISEVGIHQPPDKPRPISFFKISKYRRDAIEFPTEETAREYAFAYPKRVFAVKSHLRDEVEPCAANLAVRRLK
jgi:hypothetical protein